MRKYLSEREGLLQSESRMLEFAGGRRPQESDRYGSNDFDPDEIFHIVNPASLSVHIFEEKGQGDAREKTGRQRRQGDDGPIGASR